MTERCGACGTDGVTNSMGRFVSRDWLRASELAQKNRELREALETIRLATCDYKAGTRASLAAANKLATDALKTHNAKGEPRS